MGLIGNGSGHFFAGMAVGYVAGLLTPPAIRVMPGVVRPLIKTSLKAALLGWERGRESMALLLENLEDVVAEVRAEVEADLVRAKKGAVGDVAPAGEGAAGDVAPAREGPGRTPTAHPQEDRP